MTKLLHSVLLATLIFLTFGAQAQEQRTQILVETTKGKFILELFNETPRHRDNFMAKVKSGAYDGTIFHRVIKEFMVQGGNMLSKETQYQKTAELEDDSLSGTLEAEILPKLFVHERGMLAAVRLSDELNPKRLSSASQFYIVTGKYYTALDLKKEVEKNGMDYTQEQKDAYMYKGGAPHLDGAYTIFGRLLDGWGTIDKIQRVETDEADRPLKNIYVKRMSIYTPKR